MQGYQIVRYRPALLARAAEFHAVAFGIEPSESRRYIVWKYEENPYLQEPLLYLATARAGAIVGMRGFYGTCWMDRGSAICIPCADDFAIAEADRNTGLATLLMRASIDDLRSRGFDSVLNNSGGTLTVLQQLAMGWKSLGPMEPMACRNRWGHGVRAIEILTERLPILDRLGRHVRSDASRCFESLDRSVRNAPPDRHCLTASRSPRSAAMSALSAECMNSRRISHVRDPRFFDWRLRNPTREYRCLYLERDGRLCGYLIIAAYHQFRYHTLACSIVDLVGRTERDKAELIGAALSWGRFSAIGAWASGFTEETRRELTRVGFVPTELDARARGMPCALMKELRPHGGRDRSIVTASWDIRQLDSMRG